MTRSAVQPSAVLVLRVWVEEAPRRLRARLLEPVGLDGPELSVRVTDGLDPTAAAVRDWLSEVLGPDGEPE